MKLQYIILLSFSALLAALCWRTSQSRLAAKMASDTTPASNVKIFASSSTTREPQRTDVSDHARLPSAVSALPNWRISLQTLRNDPSLDPTGERLRHLIASLTLTELQEALTKNTADWEIKLHLTRRWAELDPRTAARWALAQTNAAAASDALIQVAIGWAAGSSEEAVAWAKSLPPSETKDQVLQQLGLYLSSGNPMKAIELALALRDVEKGCDLTKHILRYQNDHDLRITSAWAIQLPPGAFRDAAVSSLAVAWAEHDPRYAVDLLHQELSASDEQMQAAIAILHRWAERDPQPAADWAMRFPEGEFRNSALEILATAWSERDLASAGHWLIELEQVEMRDAAISGYLPALAVNFPDLAKQWLAVIEDPDRRHRAEMQTQALLRMHARTQNGPYSGFRLNVQLVKERRLIVRD